MSERFRSLATIVSFFPTSSPRQEVRFPLDRPVWTERRRAPLPPLPVTQRILARPDAAGVTGALISVLRRTETERRSAGLPQSRAPHRGEPCSEGDSPRATGLKTLHCIDQDTFPILFCPFPSYLPLHVCALISRAAVLSG